MKNKELSVKEEIKVLKGVKSLLNKFKTRELPPSFGLCYFLQEKITSLKPSIIVHPYDENKYIPLFTNKNALKFNATKGDYGDLWWNIRPYDFENRIAFLNWMIEELEKQKTTKSL